MAGVTPEGFQAKRLPEILSDLVESEQTNIDPDINTDDDELLGQLNNVFAQVTSEVWDLAQAVNDNFNVLSAEGTNLDDLAVLVGISRQPATNSNTLFQQYTGVDGTLITSNVILENPSTGDRFNPVDSFIIDSASCVFASYTLPTANISNNTLYRVTVNGIDYDYTSSGAATALEILSALSILITAADGVTSTFNADDQALSVISEDITIPFSIEILNYFINGVFSTTALTVAQELGAIVVPSRAVSVIILGTPGLQETINSEPYNVGRNEETDEELRTRITSSASIRGTCTVDAITSRLLDVDGVSTVAVYENDTFAVDADGRPPKSFEAFVQGGTDQDIGDAIWTSKAAGIESYGAVSVNVTDIVGIARTVYFSRPVQLILTSASVEYDAVPTGFTQVTFEAGVAQTIANSINTLDVGEDVVPNRIYCTLYEEYPTVVFSNLLINGSTDIIVVAANETAVIDILDITVSEAP